MVERNITRFGVPGHFYECPRWRDNRWWVSDMRGKAVYSFSPDGEQHLEFTLNDRPGGLDWTPGGDLLVVSMESRKLLRRRRGSQTLEGVVDATALCGDTAGFLNDMAVSKTGHAYIGFDAEYMKYTDDRGMIIHVDPHGHARVAARTLSMPNGIVFTPDGTTLVVAETTQPRFTSFSIQMDGSLGPAQEWGRVNPRVDKRPVKQPSLGDEMPAMDGCTMDSAGCIWVADVRSACLRVAPGGDVVDAVFLPDALCSFACALGGPDGKTLMICGADSNFADRVTRKSSFLFTTRVDVPVI